MSQRIKQLERVGRGAMAEVYRGRLSGEHGTGRAVAIKRLRPELRGDAAAVDLFVNEARIALQLSHPNVVHAFELGHDDAGYHLVSEWLDCTSLAALHDALGPLPWPAVAHVALSVCRALDYVHTLPGENGQPLHLVHRDVTPDNILVTGAGDVKLGDFGVATCVHSGRPMGVQAVGTPGFAAPEQQSDMVVDGRADLYGLGKSLLAVAASLPAAVQGVLERASAVEPEARFADAAAMGYALEEAIRGSDVSVGPACLRPLVSQLEEELKAPSSPALDGAVQAILGPAIDARSPAAGATALTSPATRPRGRRGPVIAGIALVALGGLFGVWWIGHPHATTSLPPDTLTAPVQMPRAPVAPPTVAAERMRRTAAAGNAAPAAGAPRQAATRAVAPPPVSENRREEGARATIRQTALVTGSVSLNSVPWAQVRIDGRAVGNTPLRDLVLRQGRHAVQLSHPPQALQRTIAIVVKGHAHQTFVVDLRRGTVRERSP